MREPKPMTPGLASLIYALQHLDMEESIRYREAVARNLKDLGSDVHPSRLAAAMREAANDIERASKPVEDLRAS